MKRLVVGLFALLIATSGGATPAAAVLHQATIARAVAAQQDAPGSAFADYAMSWVRYLADDLGPRPAGGPAEQRAAAAIAEEFATFGYEVETTPFEVNTPNGRRNSHNVIARAPNENPDGPLVIIGAHYDSVPQSPGGNDNASGTGTMLAVARQLAREPVEGVTVRYVAFGAEEIGLLGSKLYVSQMSATDRQRLRVMLSIDMMSVGSNPAFGGSQPWLRDAMARADSQGYRSLDQSAELRRLGDHTSFLDAGLPALMFYWWDDPFYHTRLDIAANVQWRSLDLMGAIAIELVRLAALR